MAASRFVLNLMPQHPFSALRDWPEAQVLLLVPQPTWAQAQRYVPQFEEVTSAGRFGADPGEYEWELLERPQGFKWWRRSVQGDAWYCAFAVTGNPGANPIEVYGMIDIGSDSFWWFDAIEIASPLQFQSEIVARKQGVSLEAARLQLSLEEYRRRGLLTAEPSGDEPAWRVGDEAEVVRFKGALVGLFDRARTAAPAPEAK